MSKLKLSIIAGALCAIALRVMAADVNLTWDTVDGADGYNVYCAPVGDTPAADPVAAPPYTLVSPPAGVSQECYVTATSSTLGVESADSNHIQFTPPEVAQTIVVPGQPSNVTIQWQ